MVHLAAVKKDSEVPVSPSLPLPHIETLDLGAPCEDEFFSSVYGSRFASEQLPQTEMPEREMPREIAYRMIKDELSLDGNPMLK
jgi:glutamate decarboxylase